MELFADYSTAFWAPEDVVQAPGSANKQMGLATSILSSATVPEQIHKPTPISIGGQLSEDALLGAPSKEHVVAGASLVHSPVLAVATASTGAKSTSKAGSSSGALSSARGGAVSQDDASARTVDSDPSEEVNAGGKSHSKNPSEYGQKDYYGTTYYAVA